MSRIADYQVVDESLLWKDYPKDKWGDYEFLIGSLDWESNVDPEFKQHHFTEPKPADDVETMNGQGYDENWITYGSEYYSAKELTVYPGCTVTIKDAAAYGMICMQGYGKFGRRNISSPSMIRFGEMTEDEFFVTYDAAKQGVQVTNLSSSEPLVMLKHFNPGNPEMPQRV